MSERTKGGVWALRSGCSAMFALLLVACGGGAKQADSPSTCPDGTVLRGSDCVPAEGAKHESSEGDTPAADDSPKAPAKTDDHSSSAAAAPDTAPAARSGGTPAYDKDAVEIELKRAVRQVKANCGSATDDDGASTGPWGKTTASVTLGRNGHVKQVTLPAQYDGKPAGLCVTHAFQKIQFPPYGGSVDVVVDREIELIKPKH
jgi:hypothetical protein